MAINSQTATGYTVQVTGIIEGIANCIVTLGKIMAGLETGLEKAGDTLADRMKAYCPVDTGELKDSITVRHVGVATVEVGPEAPYAAYVEFGAGPHVPNVDRLAGWSARHGGGDPSGIIQHIAEHGVLAHPFVGPAAAEAEGIVDAELIGMTAIISL